MTMIGPLFSLVLIGCCGYSIARYEFMDIRLVVKRGVSYGFSIAAVALIFFSIEFVVEKFFYTNDEVVDIIAAVVGALAFWRIKKFFDTLTDRIFFKQQYRFSDAVRRLGIALVATIDLDALFGAINESLGKTIKPASVTFFLIKDGAPKRFVGTAPMAVGVAIASGEQDLLVATLLDSARFNFSQASAPKQRVDLQSLLTDVCEDFEGIAKDRGVNLVVQGEQVSGAGDKDRLKEVFLNLLSNALNHTPAGGSVSFSARKIDGEAEIVIEDNGNGIPRKNLDHIFERFYRIDDGISSGTGIGLHLCRQIIEAHGGTIIAESDTGEGSRFIVRLPLFASIS